MKKKKKKKKKTPPTNWRPRACLACLLSVQCAVGRVRVRVCWREDSEEKSEGVREGGRTRRSPIILSKRLFLDAHCTALTAKKEEEEEEKEVVRRSGDRFGRRGRRRKAICQRGSRPLAPAPPGCRRRSDVTAVAQYPCPSSLPPSLSFVKSVRS